MSLLKENLSTVKSFTDAAVCAVVKADAYGHGAEAIDAFSEADEFAVSCIGEALQICDITDKPVNILSLPDRTAEGTYAERIYPAVATVDDVEFVAARKGAKAVNIKVNTGMNRYGASADELDKLIEAIRCHSMTVKSIFSHIYDLSAAQNQFEYFMSIVKPYGDIAPKHILSSNFVSLPRYMHLDMVRPGIVLYGYGHNLVKSAISAHCGVTQVRKVSANDNIGYGIRRSGRPRTVAVLGAGYADGCRRIAENMPRYTEINGNLCPVVGQICMDAMMVDVTGLDVKVGDDAYILSDNYDASAIAASCGTISYEILTGFGKRVAREYIRG